MNKDIDMGNSLHLVRVRDDMTNYYSYIPENLIYLLKDRDTLAVSAVWRNTICGTAVAERYGDAIELRSIYVDSEFRNIGLAVYILKGLINTARKEGVTEIYAHYTRKTLSNHESILTRSGFGEPKASADGFTIAVGDIPEIPNPDIPFKDYTFNDAPSDLMETYRGMCSRNELPAYVNVLNVRKPLKDISFLIADGKKIAGVLIGEENASGLRLAGLYSPPEYRGKGPSIRLLSLALTEAQKQYPKDTLLTIDAISKGAIRLCEKLLPRKSLISKETELCAVCKL